MENLKLTSHLEKRIEKIKKVLGILEPSLIKLKNEGLQNEVKIIIKNLLNELIPEIDKISKSMSLFVKENKIVSKSQIGQVNKLTKLSEEVRNLDFSNIIEVDDENMFTLSESVDNLNERGRDLIDRFIKEQEEAMQKAEMFLGNLNQINEELSEMSIKYFNKDFAPSQFTYSTFLNFLNKYFSTLLLLRNTLLEIDREDKMWEIYELENPEKLQEEFNNICQQIFKILQRYLEYIHSNSNPNLIFKPTFTTLLLLQDNGLAFCLEETINLNLLDAFKNGIIAYQNLIKIDPLFALVCFFEIKRNRRYEDLGKLDLNKWVNRFSIEEIETPEHFSPEFIGLLSTLVESGFDFFSQLILPLLSLHIGGKLHNNDLLKDIRKDFQRNIYSIFPILGRITGIDKEIKNILELKLYGSLGIVICHIILKYHPVIEVEDSIDLIYEKIIEMINLSSVDHLKFKENIKKMIRALYNDNILLKKDNNYILSEEYRTYFLKYEELKGKKSIQSYLKKILEIFNKGNRLI